MFSRPKYEFLFYLKEKLIVKKDHSLMKERKEVSHHNDDGFRVGRDDHLELCCSLCIILYF